MSCRWKPRRGCTQSTHDQELGLPPGDDLLPLLPRGFAHPAAWSLSGWLGRQPVEQIAALQIPVSDVKLLLPIPRPNKLFLLAGNYADHIREGGGVAAERTETFPYVFMKPPTTTLTHPGDPIFIPAISPNAIDWELELAVVIGTSLPQRERVGSAEHGCRLHDRERHLGSQVPTELAASPTSQGRVL